MAQIHPYCLIVLIFFTNVLFFTKCKFLKKEIKVHGFCYDKMGREK